MKRWLLAVAVMVMAIFAFAFVACSDDDEDGDGGEPTTAAETPAGGETPVGSAAIAEMSNAIAGAVTGTATITENEAAGTDVVVTITAGLEEGSHQSHIHHGDCSDTSGEIHVDLAAVVAVADGSAAAVTTTDPLPQDGSAAPPFSHWLSSPHYVAVHALDGTVAFCGDVVAAS